MTALFIIIAAIALLIVGYITYGSWLAKQWGVDPTGKLPRIPWKMVLTTSLHRLQF